MARGGTRLGGYRVGDVRETTNAYTVYAATHDSGYAATIKLAHPSRSSMVATQREA